MLAELQETSGSLTRTAQRIPAKTASDAVGQILTQVNSVVAQPYLIHDVLDVLDTQSWRTSALVSLGDTFDRFVTTSAVIQPIALAAIEGAIRSVWEQANALSVDFLLLPSEGRVQPTAPELPLVSPATAHVRRLLTVVPPPDQPTDDDVDQPMGFTFPDFG